MINYNVIVRGLTEWTGTNQSGTLDQTSINEGIGGITHGHAPGTGFPVVVNTRQTFIQGVGKATNSAPDARLFPSPPNSVPNLGVVRRYQVNFALGLFTQDKLVTVKTHSRFLLNLWLLNWLLKSLWKRPRDVSLQRLEVLLVLHQPIQYLMSI